MSKWRVDLTNQHAACMYRGKECRTMRAAFNSAMKRASKQFLSYRESVTYGPRSDLDYERQWSEIFESCRTTMRLMTGRNGHCTRVCDSGGRNLGGYGLYVDLVRV